jgi:hypothetical protein
MKIIQKLTDYIEDELDGAEEYAKEALLYKEENPTLAKSFYEISLEEMRHVDILHSRVVELIEKHRKEHGEPPAAMMVIYEHIHKKNIEWANEIKSYQAEFRG